jgi:hypothetical protein
LGNIVDDVLEGITEIGQSFRVYFIVLFYGTSRALNILDLRKCLSLSEMGCVIALY